MHRIASLWGGFAAERRDAKEGKPGTTLHLLPARRFAVAAKWLSTLLEEALKREDFGSVALRRILDNSHEKLDHPSLPPLVRRITVGRRWYSLA